MFDPSLVEQCHGSPHSEVTSLSLLNLPLLQYHGILELKNITKLGSKT